MNSNQCQNTPPKTDLPLTASPHKPGIKATLYDIAHHIHDSHPFTLGKHEVKHPVPDGASTTDVSTRYQKGNHSQNSSQYSLVGAITSVHELPGIFPLAQHVHIVPASGHPQPNKPLHPSTAYTSEGGTLLRADSLGSSNSESGFSSMTSARSNDSHRPHSRSRWMPHLFHPHSEHPDEDIKDTRASTYQSPTSHSSVPHQSDGSTSSVVPRTSPEIMAVVKSEMLPLPLANAVLDRGITFEPPVPMDVALLPLMVEDYTDRIERIENGEKKIGGYSDVIQARDRITGTLIAVKCLRANDLGGMDPTSCEGKDRMRKRLHRELRVLQMVPHARVSRLLGHAVFEDRLALVTQWYCQGNLSEYLQRHPQASRPRLVSQVGQGLTHLHVQDPPVAHSDIKPANVLIDAIGDAALSDFGLAKFLDGVRTGLTTKNDSGHSVRYCAPEILEGGPGTLAADVYAFACLAFEVLTGKLPFYEHTKYSVLIMMKSGKVLPSRWDCPELPDRVWGLLVRCWSPEPENRPDMMELMQELTNLGWYQPGSFLPNVGVRAHTA